VAQEMFDKRLSLTIDGGVAVEALALGNAGPRAPGTSPTRATIPRAASRSARGVDERRVEIGTIRVLQSVIDQLSNVKRR
jgi:hypothetical protein